MKHSCLKYFLTVFCLLLIPIYAFSRQYRYFGVNDGLSSSNVVDITQDSEGFLWIATEDGLNRFDGNNFIVYRNILNDTTSLINNHVTKVWEDKEGRLWVSTFAGLCLYDRTTDRFVRYDLSDYAGKNDISQCYELKEDSRGYIWVSISGNGVIRIKPDDHEITSFNTKNSGICSDHINVIYEDGHGNIWMGSGWEGLSIYNQDNGSFRTYQYDPNDKNSLSSNEISSICEDLDGNVWVGTWVGGINIYSFSTRSFQLLDYKANKISFLKKDSKQNVWIGMMNKGVEAYSLTEKKIVDPMIRSASADITSKVGTIYEDKQGNIWLGLYHRGLFMASSDKGFFTNYTFNPFAEKPTIGDGAVQPVLVDSSNELWVGVDGKGLYRMDKDKNIVAYYGTDSKNALSDNVALCIFEDSRKNVWIGTFFDGAICYNRSVDRFDKKITYKTKPYGLLNAQINDIDEDKDKKILFSTNGGGVNIYDPVDGSFEYIIRDESKSDSNQLIDNYCSTTCVDHKNVYWIGTFRGLCAYNKAQKQFVYYSVKDGSLPNDNISYLKEDSKKNMWVGTYNGLVRIDSTRQHIKMYSTSDGLLNSMIKSIEEDNEGNIWIVTNNGLSMLNTEEQTFINYTTSDGLYTNEFKRDAITKAPDGEFIIGSMRGFVSFYPSERTQLRLEPLNLLFNELYIYSEPVDISNSHDAVLQKAINYVDDITLNHEQNSFSIEFGVIDFLSPDKVKYEVKMEGFDINWQTVKNRMTTYTNLSPGDYTLRVRAWSDNIDNALEKTLVVKILPPFWATTRAKIAYFILCLTLAYLIYRFISERMSTKRNEQLMQAKLQFFTDISHEIRTPLTLILSPLNKLIGSNNDIKLTSIYNIMYKNGVRLLQLVNQVMDLHAVEFGKKKLYMEDTNVTMFVRELKKSFNNLAEEKNLSYTFSSTPEDIMGYIDTDIISKVLFNIISNAFKYTDNGFIAVSLKINNNKLIIAVSDSGKGLSSEQRSLIFERFYMVDPLSSERKKSSGIGLHLTGRLVKLHHGRIWVDSEEGKGSCFSVEIPFKKEGYVVEEFAENNPISSKIVALIQPDSKNGKSEGRFNKHKHSILIVEDNRDIKDLIISQLSDMYQIFEASDGKEGLQLAIEKKPSLVISDVMMQEMDGIELCQKIRNNDQTMHIPFIMLTARSSVSQQIEGLEHGADAYITKPFDLDYLHAQIERLIVSKEKIDRQMATIGKNETVYTSGVVSASNDSKFLKKLGSIINEHLDDTELSVDFLCQRIGLSRTHLNRKMRDLVGESPASYIKQLRLRESVRLIKERNLSISEIAFKVGFSSPSYFSQAFRDYYGLTPKEYINTEPLSKPDIDTPLN